MNNIPRDWPHTFTTIGLGVFAVLIFLTSLEGIDIALLISISNRFSELSSAAQVVVGFLLTFMAHFVGQVFLTIGEFPYLYGDTYWKRRMSDRIEIAKGSRIAEAEFLRATAMSRLLLGISCLMIMALTLQVVQILFVPSLKFQLTKELIGLFFFAAISHAASDTICFAYYDSAYLNDKPPSPEKEPGD